MKKYKQEFPSGLSLSVRLLSGLFFFFLWYHLGLYAKHLWLEISAVLEEKKKKKKHKKDKDFSCERWDGFWHSMTCQKASLLAKATPKSTLQLLLTPNPSLHPEVSSAWFSSSGELP